MLDKLVWAMPHLIDEVENFTVEWVHIHTWLDYFDTVHFLEFGEDFLEKFLHGDFNVAVHIVAVPEFFVFLFGEAFVFEDGCDDLVVGASHFVVFEEATCINIVVHKHLVA